MKILTFGSIAILFAIASLATTHPGKVYADEFSNGASKFIVILAAKAKIDVYLRNSAGIGEHPDIVAAVDTEMEKLADAEDKLKTLNSNFKSSSTNPQVLSEQKELDI